MVTEAYKIKKVPDLTAVDFTIPELIISEKRSINKNEIFEVVFNGIPLFFNIEFLSIPNNLYNLHRSFYLDIVIRAARTREINVQTIAAEIVLKVRENYPDETLIAETSVSNNDQKLVGLGRAIWEMALQLIQKIADRSNTSITHIVERASAFWLSEDKWDKLFLPLLEKYGYISTRRGKWKYTYMAHKK